MSVIKFINGTIKVTIAFYIYFIAMILLGFSDYSALIFTDLGIFFAFIYMATILFISK